MNKISICTAIAVLALASNANAEHNHSENNNDPIGVMGAHVHEEGDWMLSYRLGSMRMQDNRIGTNIVTAAEARAAGPFMVAPTSMDIDMHMFGAMYGATEDLTLMASIPYIDKSMWHQTGGGVNFRTEAKGFGDAKFSGLYKLTDSLHLNIGISTPTGSITERDDTPAMANAKLPYPMQLGSGTVDPILGITYNAHEHNWNWGVQGSTVQRLYDNSEGYHLGDEYNATAWIGRSLNDCVGVNFRLDGRIWQDISGADGDLNPAMVPTARTDLRGGKRVDVVIGANLFDSSGGLFGGNKLAAEFGMPLYQNLDGPQLETDYRFTLGWQYNF